MDPSLILTLASVLASLVGAIAYTIRHVVGTTIPSMQMAHAQQVEHLCRVFADDNQHNRALALHLHGEMLTTMSRLAESVRAAEEAIQGNQLSLVELLERTSSNGHANGLRLYRPEPGAVDSAEPGSDDPGAA